MTDALKRAHECCPCTVDYRSTMCPNGIVCACYPETIQRNPRPCQWIGHAALDEAVEEAKKVQVGLALEIAAHERERGRREALDELHAPDACPECSHVIALLKEPAQGEKCPVCRSAFRGNAEYPCDTNPNAWHKARP